MTIIEYNVIVVKFSSEIAISRKYSQTDEYQILDLRAHKLI